jgi:hypothetical protein
MQRSPSKAASVGGPNALAFGEAIIRACNAGRPRANAVEHQVSNIAHKARYTADSAADDPLCPDWGWESHGFLREGHHSMTLHQQILTSAATTDQSDVLRLRALFCEREARQSKQDWEVLAIECHMMAYLAARMNGEISQIDVARHVDSLWCNRLPAHHEGPLPHPAQ